MIIEIVLGVLLIVTVLWCKNLPRLRIRGFPSPPGVFILGHAPYINSSQKVLPYFNKHLILNDGFIKIIVGSKALLVVSDYEFIKWVLKSDALISKSEEYDYLKAWLGQGLLLSTGSYWKSRRKILTPAFHFQRIENLVDLLQNISDTLVEKLYQNLDKDSVDIFPIISSFALDAVCESSMATQVHAQTNDKSDYVRAVGHICRIMIDRAFDAVKMFDMFFWFHPDYKVLYDSVETIHTFDSEVIKERKKILRNINIEQNEFGSKYKSPFLDILLTARKENGESLTDKEIREEVDTMMFAGYETTASAISFTLYNLAHHLEVQNKAVEEQRCLFGNSVDPKITYSILTDMKYLEMVIKESLRLYPPVPFIGRKVHEDMYYNGKLIPKGLTLTLVLFSLHRNPKLYPDPETFNPSRFENDNETFSYLPFSAGPRNCIGQKFAMVEMKQVISRILLNFELLPATPAHTLKLAAEASLKSASGICIKLKKRLH